MRTRALAVGVAMAIAFAVAPRAVAQSTDLPAGWIRAGSHPNDYDMGVDPKVSRAGKASAFIRGKGASPSGFGTLMQMFDAQEYRGKRLRLSAWVKAEGISAWAGLWMRVDGPQKPTAFDNMQNRPIKGTQTWRQHQVVLDVAPDATGIAFGILLTGPGAAWIDDLSFAVVGPEVPVTSAQGWGSGPRNLSFEE